MTAPTPGAMPIWSVVPFVGLLLSIAVLPLTAPRWWHHSVNQALVSGAWALPVGLYLAWMGASGMLLHSAVEYASFICLVGSLYVVSGNLFVSGNLLGTPRTNLAFLAIGSVLANIIGTAGASVVLIRPLLRANSDRKHLQHIVVFFIFTVSNCGGLLTPLGDPPLFLGFLRGVPFFWTLRLWPQWLFCLACVLVTFYVWERRAFRREAPDELVQDMAHYVPWRLEGKVNGLLLAVIIAAVVWAPLILREVVMVLAAAASLWLTDQAPRRANQFTFGPLREVAILFAGIFVAMVPALALLQANGGAMGLTEPWQYFWLTGSLSALLDNAPTYLTFASTATGAFGVDAADLRTLIAAGDGAGQRILEAIACGAVFMGACSYIGNAPNFLVKSIAEESGVPMPSFFGYMGQAILVLGPPFLLMTLLFFL